MGKDELQMNVMVSLLNIIHYNSNYNLNHNEIPLYPC